MSDDIIAFCETRARDGVGIYPSLAEDVTSRILPHNPRMFTEHRPERIEPHMVTLARLPDRETIKAHTDGVVLAMGVRPRKNAAEEFQATFDRVHVVGDAVGRAGAF